MEAKRACGQPVRGLSASAMMRLLLSLAGALVVALFVSGASAAPERHPESGLQVAPLAVVQPDGTRHEFRVELARTAGEQSRGLMHRRELAADAGMLFLFRRPRVANFWMRNTFVPLDMIWIARDREGTPRILGAHENAVPHSTRSISSNLPVDAVLEVPGGTVARLGLARGDRIEAEALD
jgi:hypothetical protein